MLHFNWLGVWRGISGVSNPRETTKIAQRSASRQHCIANLDRLGHLSNNLQRTQANQVTRESVARFSQSVMSEMGHHSVCQSFMHTVSQSYSQSVSMSVSLSVGTAVYHGQSVEPNTWHWCACHSIAAHQVHRSTSRSRSSSSPTVHLPFTQSAWQLTIAWQAGSRELHQW